MKSNGDKKTALLMDSFNSGGSSAAGQTVKAMSMMKNPEDVEKILALRREKLPVKKAPPSRAGMIGELKHPGIPTLVSGWFEINQERALHWLDYNLCNRKMNKHKVRSFARQHAQGDFIATHQGIAFNDADELVDGQHTLKMVVLSGQPLLRMVTFGLPKKNKNVFTMDVIDAGGRSVADQLTIAHGIQQSGLKKQICAALASLCYGQRARLPGVRQILEVLEAFGPSIEFVVVNRSKERGLKQAGVLAGFAFAHAALGKPIEELFKVLNSGVGLMDFEAYSKRREKNGECRPIEHLRHFLTGPESALFSVSMNREIAAVVLQVVYAEQHKAKTKELEQSAVGTKWFANKQAARVEKIAALFKLPVGK